jgi:F0F1-type ATP synthase delta subunit
MKKDILIYFDLITSLKTTQEVACFVSEIDNLMLAFFKSKEVSMKKALEVVNEDFAQKIMQIFSKNNLDIKDRDVVVGFFETLKELLKKFKIIKLVLAFNPTCKTIENIHNFVKDILGIGYILDIEISEDVLGGAIIVFEGKYSDFSLKKKIEEVFALKNKEALRLYN